MGELMRIGPFSRMFGVVPSTVRYYIQRGFLVPKTQNKQYLFHEDCVNDMRQIMEWKELRFSLDDIHELLTLQRKFNRSLPDDVQPYLLLLNHQKKKLQQDLAEILLQLEQIESLMDDFGADQGAAPAQRPKKA